MGGAGAALGGGKGGGGTSGGGYSSMANAAAAAAQVAGQLDAQGIASLQQYYQQAQQQFSNYYNTANTDIQTANTQSQAILQGGFNQGTQALLSGQQQAGAYLAPYINQGLPALDAYSQSMGIGTPVGGSLAAFNAQQAAATAQQNTNLNMGTQYQSQLAAYNQQQNQFNNQLQALNGGAGSGGVLPNMNAPGAATGTTTGGSTSAPNTGYVYDPTTGIATRAATTGSGADTLTSTVNSAIDTLNSWNTNGSPSWGTDRANSLAQSLGATSLATATPTQLQQIATSLSQDFGNLKVGVNNPIRGQLTSAAAGYVAPQTAQTQNIGMAPIAPTAPNYLAAQTPIAPAPQMTSNADAANQGLQNFYGSPEYQALYGNGQSAQQLAGNTAIQNFQQAPGYQFQLQQGLQATQNNAIAQGQGYSPAMQQALTGYATGLANQSYNTYQQGLASTFNQYQSQLQNLTGMGATASGAGATLAQQTGQGINSNAGTLATDQSNTNTAAGNAMSNNAMTGANTTSSLAQNQGNSLSNAYTNEANTQANALLGVGQAQAAQSQYQNSATASAQGGIGAGIGALGSLFGSSSGGSSSGGGSMLGGAGKGAASGAAAGSMFGPWGTAIGAVGGGILGAFSSK
jgi:hypothetical protein